MFSISLNYQNISAISSLYHHDNLYPWAGPGIVVGGGGGGGSQGVRLTGKSSDVFFLSFVSPQLILQNEFNDVFYNRKLSFNYIFLIYRGGGTTCLHCKRSSQTNCFFINDIFIFLKKICVSLPTMYDFIAKRLKGSPHQEVYEDPVTIPHTPPLKHMSELENLKVL